MFSTMQRQGQRQGQGEVEIQIKGPGGAGADEQQDIKTTTSPPAEKKGVVDIHEKALDDLVHVNSLFTLAVFVGLSLAGTGERSLENRTECNAGRSHSKRIVLNEVASFACFLLSSLVAKALKIHVSICKLDDLKYTGNQVLRGAMLLLSVWASVFGCIFLTISMVEVIQIKVGTLSCGSVDAWTATGSLIAIVLLALAIYVPFMMNAIFTSLKTVE